MIVLQFTFTSVNVSIQPGDTMCYITNLSQSGQFTFGTTNTSPILLFGEVVGVTNTTIDILYDDVLNPNPIPVPPNDFLICIKDKSVNTSSLIGYFMEVEFKNNSLEHAEMFAMGSEVEESSK